jgi:hypothetical protein
MSKKRKLVDVITIDSDDDDESGTSGHRVRLSTIWFGSKKIPQPDSHEDGCMH